jgi:REP element-mobilizing transposase RayT
MSEFRKANTENSYFLTCSVVGWIDIFTRSVYSDIILESFEFCRKNKGLEIFGFVIMPSHIHFIARSIDNKLPDILRDFKAHTARQILKSIETETDESWKDWLLHMFSYYGKYQKQNEKYQFWQKTNHPIELYSAKIFEQKLDYIHMNPVEAGYVKLSENWVYSSANPFCSLKVDES